MKIPKSMYKGTVEEKLADVMCNTHKCVTTDCVDCAYFKENFDLKNKDIAQETAETLVWLIEGLEDD